MFDLLYMLNIENRDCGFVWRKCSFLVPFTSFGFREIVKQFDIVRTLRNSRDVPWGGVEYWCHLVVFILMSVSNVTSTWSTLWNIKLISVSVFLILINRLAIKSYQCVILANQLKVLLLFGMQVLFSLHLVGDICRL